MNNYKLSKGIEFIDRKAYSLYLRSESVKKLINPLYEMDKSFGSFMKSKFYDLRYISYSQYLSEQLEDSIAYSEYVSESIDKSISYTEYLAEQCSLVTSSNISYSSYIAEKI
jgi:hypothetical protein